MKRFLLLIVIVCAFLWHNFALSGSYFGDPARGRILYSQRCTMCHGSDGRGNNSMAPNFFEEWHRLTKTDGELADNIRSNFRTPEGSYTTGSCPKHSFNDEDMEDLLAYLRRLTENRPLDPLELEFDKRGGFNRRF